MELGDGSQADEQIFWRTLRHVMLDDPTVHPIVPPEKTNGHVLFFYIPMFVLQK